MLKIIRETIDENEKLITKVDLQIDKSLALYQVELELLQTIDGVRKGYSDNNNKRNRS